MVPNGEAPNVFATRGKNLPYGNSKKRKDGEIKSEKDRFKIKIEKDDAESSPGWCLVI